MRERLEDVEHLDRFVGIHDRPISIAT